MSTGRPPRAAVRAAVRASLADLDPGERVIVALSGGADSLALTAAAVVVGAELGLLCEAVVIDHQLQSGSGEVAARAAEQARILGCVHARVIAVDVPRGSGSGGVEAAARAARYAALDAAAGAMAGAPPAAAILMGHTREDQAETVLLGLARGSGTRSLAGMAARTGVYRRPLLDLPRDVVVAAAREAAAADPGLEPWTDPHNSDAGFARVRVRHEVLPVLAAALGPGIAEALARTATLARADADALDAWADEVWAQVLESAAESRNGSAQAWPPAPQQLGNDSLQEQQRPSEFTVADGVGGGEPTSADGAGGGEGTAAELGSAEAPGRTARPVGTLPINVLTRASHSNPHGGPLPPAIVSRVVHRFLVAAGCPTGSLSHGHIRAVAVLLEPGAPARSEVALPGGRRARREDGAVVVRV
jgi:tRNA(Ile)-lysidine synthetase-like protein